jgi:acyl-ACP thioesterase
MNNTAYWSAVEDYLFTTPKLLEAPLRIAIEHEAPVALSDKLEILTHRHPAGTTEAFGPALVDRPVTTLTYAVGDETKAIAAIFALDDVGEEVSVSAGATGQPRQPGARAIRCR